MRIGRSGALSEADGRADRLPWEEPVRQERLPERQDH
jgi:hypothetical protein